MKTLHKLSWVFGLAAVIAFGSCGGGSDPDPEPEPTPAQKATRMLTAGSGTWAPAGNAGITVDGVDVTNELFEGFSIKFADGTYTTTGTTPVFPREDTWKFKDESGTVIIRGSDDREMTLSEISDTQLKLTLYWDETTTDAGRTGSLKGKHEFLLKK